MRVELIYRLAPGVRAQDVDLSFDNQKVARRAVSNPDGKTLLQLFNNWFNVKVALVEADGTETVLDYADKELNRFYTSGHLPNKKVGSAFIFGYNRSLGQMAIKVVSREPQEEPALIIRHHLEEDYKSPTVPVLLDLTEQKEYALPFANDPAINAQLGRIGACGTSVSFLDKNKPMITEHRTLRTSLDTFDFFLRAALARQKRGIYDRHGEDRDDFYGYSIYKEVSDLSKTRCLELLTEIDERNLSPKVINNGVLEKLLEHMSHLRSGETDVQKSNSEAEDYQKPLKIGRVSCTEKWSEPSYSADIVTITPCLNPGYLVDFQANGLDHFTPDDFLATPNQHGTL